MLVVIGWDGVRYGGAMEMIFSGGHTGTGICDTIMQT